MRPIAHKLLAIPLTILDTFQLSVKSSAVTQSLTAFLGNILSSFIFATALILISRLLGPQQFGIFSIATALIVMFSRIIDSGLNAVMTRFLPEIKENKTQAKQLIKQVLWWRLWICVFGIIGMWLLGPEIQNILNYQQPELWGSIILGAILLVIFNHCITIMSTFDKYAQVNMLLIVQGMIKLVSILVVILLGYGVTQSLVFLYAVAPIITIFLSWKWLKEWLWMMPAKISATWQQAIIRFAPHSLVGTFALVIISHIDLLFVQSNFSSFDTGIYAGASRITQVVTAITLSSATVFNNRATRYHDRATQKKYLQKSLIVTLLSVMGFVCFVPVSKLIIMLTIGPEYISGLSVLLILVANAFLGLALIPYISFFYALDVPQYFSIGGILQAVTIVAINSLYLTQFGLTAAAYSRLIATIIFGLYTVGMIWYWWGRQSKK